MPLAISLTGGHRNDVTQLIPLIAAIGSMTGKRGRPRQRPDALYGDRGYDHDKHRGLLRKRGVLPMMARRGQPHGSGLGRIRWVGLRRLRLRYERYGELHTAFTLTSS